jgi:pSer/pThr/pTyr-binding forkhead associated (FHA) protein
MWAIRVLSGPQAGQVFPLKTGKIKLGRGSNCQIQWTAQGVSKEHLEFSIQAEKVSVTDLQSSNGTFLNGVRIQSSFLKLGDKLLVGHTLCDIVVMSERALQRAAANSNLPVPTNNTPALQQPMVPMNPMDHQMPMASNLPAHPPANVFQAQSQRLQDYVDRVALPGVYKLPEVMEFRFVLMGFIGLYIVLLTFLSMVPLYQITSESISTESKRRALTVARSLSEINQKALRQGDYSGFRTDLILREEGIEDAYVISKDGKILAPSERIGLSPREVGFTSKLKGTIREVTDQSSLDGKVAASVPIVAFDAELQQNVAKGYAIVVYNPGNLTFDDGRAFSLSCKCSLWHWWLECFCFSSFISSLSILSVYFIRSWISPCAKAGIRFPFNISFQRFKIY